jgi:catalase
MHLLTCRFDFDPLDATKIWPEELFPMQPVGRMVLNRNIDNFFSENEQVAFSPAVIVPGRAVNTAAGSEQHLRRNTFDADLQ